VIQELARESLQFEQVEDVRFTEDVWFVHDGRIILTCPLVLPPFVMVHRESQRADGTALWQAALSRGPE